MKILLGADPEFFLKRNGVNVAAVGLVPGTKEAPYRLKNGAVQLDGTAVEFNIDPAETADQFRENILDVLEQVREIVPKEYEFDFTPSVVYAHTLWDLIPKEAKELGCNPDYDAYTLKSKVPPALPRNLNTMRTGAGHLHIGFTETDDPLNPSHMFDCSLVVKSLDRVFQYLTWYFDDDKRRQQLYGQYGSFRPKRYGVEYRVLSNAWLRYPDMWPWLFNTVQCVVNTLENGKDLHSLHLYCYDLNFINKELGQYLGPDYKPFEKSMMANRLVV